MQIVKWIPFGGGFAASFFAHCAFLKKCRSGAKNSAFIEGKKSK